MISEEQIRGDHHRPNRKWAKGAPLAHDGLALCGATLIEGNDSSLSGCEVCNSLISQIRKWPR